MISLIIPAFNREESMGKTVESAKSLLKNLKNKEI